MYHLGYKQILNALGGIQTWIAEINIWTCTTWAAKLQWLENIWEHKKVARDKGITWLFAYCKGGNFNIHIWVRFGYFVC